MVGLPRSGKTTEAKKLGKELNAPIVNLDALRLAVHGTAFNQDAEDLIWPIAKYNVIANFEYGYDTVIIDAPNNTRKRRKFWEDKRWVREYICINTPLEECVKRAGIHNPLVNVIYRMNKDQEPISNDDYTFAELSHHKQIKGRPVP